MSTVERKVMLLEYFNKYIRLNNTAIITVLAFNKFCTTTHCDRRSRERISIDCWLVRLMLLLGVIS
jgi:hypothetical protein